MLSSMLNSETREEIRILLDIVLFPLKMYCILLLIFIMVIIFQLYLIIKK